MVNRKTKLYLKNDILLFPKYKIGDIVLYFGDEEYRDEWVQSKIVTAICAFEPEGNLGYFWIYDTEQTLADADDHLMEENIIKKLN